MPPVTTRVQTVQRAWSVLSLLMDRPGGETVKGIASATDLDRAVVYRLLRTMADEALVEAYDSRYRLGARTVELGFSYLNQLEVRGLALSYTVDFHRRVIADRPWIISLSVPVREHVVIVDRIWGTGTPLNLLLDIGTRLRIDESASGRAILAAMPNARVVEVVGKARAANVKSTLDRIRRQGGLSIAHDEFYPGMSAAAVALGSPAVGALVVSGTHLGPQLDFQSPVVQELMRAATAISSRLQRTLAQDTAVGGE